MHANLPVFSNHRYQTYTRIESNRNQNNNQQSSSTTLDVAECIDGDLKLIPGSLLLLAKGTLLLDDAHASRVISTVQIHVMP